MPRTAKPPKDKVEEAIDNAVVNEEVIPTEEVPLPAAQSDIPDAKIPEPTDPEWQDYVLAQFGDGDKDPDGYPMAEACRQVVERLLGVIVREKVRTIQVPTPDNDGRATVEVSVHIAWGGDRDDIREFDDVADVYAFNMDPRFARFPTASAKTKALGRAYKSALKLKRVYTSEELASKEVPVVDVGFDRVITLSQRRFIDKVCRDLDIDVMKFINSGERQYKDIIQVPYARADRMIKILAKYQQDTATVPINIKGYDTSWQKGEMPQ